MNQPRIQEARQAIHQSLSALIVGQERTIDLLLVALFTGGHVLLEGQPGLAKTLLVRGFAKTLSLNFGRIQFTPDLMPGDVLGTNLFNFQSNAFALTKGPIFTDVLLADEINRTPPKTQAALLQAMQERCVTIDGKTYPLGDAFTVIATQNPIEQEGTYPLPEAQLDRFLFKVVVPYPSRDEERRIVAASGRTASAVPTEAVVRPVLSATDLRELRGSVDEVRISDEITNYVVDVVRRTRESNVMRMGASPRAAAALAAAARALAALSGRDYVLPDDVKALAEPTLAHRVGVNVGAAMDGTTPAMALAQLLATVEAPR